MEQEQNQIPVVSIVGESHTGKTTLLEKIIPDLIRRGYRVATIKHDGHGFDIDREGKDSWRHRQAGATTTVLSSTRRVAVLADVEKDLDIAALRDLYIRHADIILTEGFKRNRFPKIEVFRADLKDDIISRGDELLLAVVGDIPPPPGVPCFASTDVQGIVDLIVARVLRSAH